MPGARDRIDEISASSEFALAGACGPVPYLVSARADTWPSRIVKLEVGFPPGGGLDSAARIAASRLSDMWGQRSSSRTGPAPAAALRSMPAHAAPDGYTMFWRPVRRGAHGLLFDSLMFDPVATSRRCRWSALIPISSWCRTLRRSQARGFHRLCQGQSWQDHLGVARRRLDTVSGRRIIQAHGRRRHYTRAVSRRCRRRHDRSARRAARRDV